MASLAQVLVMPPPDIDAPDLKGTKVFLEDYRGKAVLVDFWATWCVPCRRSIPIYAEMQRKLKDKGFEVIAISVDEERSNVVAFAKRNHLPFRVVHDAKGAIVERYEPPKMPTSYLIDPQGRLVRIFAGFNNDTHKTLEKMVGQMLKEMEKATEPAEESPGKEDKKAPDKD